MKSVENTVESANIQHALTFGTREEREVSRQIIKTIGEAVARDLTGAEPGITQVEQAQLPLLVSQPVRKYIERYMGNEPLNIEAWEILRQFLQEQANIKLIWDVDETSISEIAEFYASGIEGYNFHEPLFLDDDIFAQREEVKKHLGSSDEKIFPIVLDAGRGSRQGLLSLVSGSKGRITLFGQELRSLAVRSLALLIGRPPSSRRWCAVLPCDALFLPSLDDKNVVENQLIDGPEMFVFTQSPNELAFFGEDFTTIKLIEKLLIRGFLSLRNQGLEKIVRGLVRGGLVFHRRFTFQENGGDQLPSGRLMTIRMLHSLLDSYSDIAEDGRPFWNRHPAGAEFCWYGRVTTAMRTSLDEWRLLWGPDTGFSSTDWDMVWRKENQFRPDTMGIYYPGLWMNLNTPVAVHVFYRNATNSSTPVIQARIRKLIGLPLDEDNIDSMIEGDIDFAGDYLLHRSRIHVPAGVKLIVGKRVVIDRSLIELEKNTENTILRIPDDTVIVDSHIKGSLKGDGCNGLIYRFFSRDGLSFHAETVQTTLFLKDRQQKIFRHAVDYQPESNSLSEIYANLDRGQIDKAVKGLLQVL